MRIIDADALFKKKRVGTIGNLSGDFVAGFDIDTAPTIDAVPVVRCRECKHGKRGVDNIVKCSHPCGKVIYMTAEDFCSYGQKD